MKQKTNNALLILFLFLNSVVTALLNYKVNIFNDLNGTNLDIVPYTILIYLTATFFGMFGGFYIQGTFNAKT